MSDRQRLNLDNARNIQKANYETVGRYLLMHQLDCTGYSVSPDVLEAAAEMIRSAGSEYSPSVVDLERHDGEDEPSPTLALVNTDDQDDVILCLPRFPGDKI